MKKLKNIVLNLFFPCRCIFCQRLMPIKAEIAVCEECMKKLPFCLAHMRCRVCGKPISGGKLCSHCAAYPRRAYRRICSSYVYSKQVKTALVKFKHEKYKGYTRVFAEHMKAVAEYDFKDIKFDAVISVPPRPARMRTENYDQVECLARELAGKMRLPYWGGVLKQIETRYKQSELSAADRAANVRGNYRVLKADKILGKTLLLVDDICTTRATLAECAKVLKKAGAKTVCCVTAATTPEWKNE